MIMQSGKYKTYSRCLGKLDQIGFVSCETGSKFDLLMSSFRISAGFVVRRCWGLGGRANSKGDRNPLDCRSQVSWLRFSIWGEPTLLSTSVSSTQALSVSGSPGLSWPWLLGKGSPTIPPESLVRFLMISRSFNFVLASRRVFSSRPTGFTSCK